MLHDICVFIRLGLKYFENVTEKQLEMKRDERRRSRRNTVGMGLLSKVLDIVDRMYIELAGFVLRHYNAVQALQLLWQLHFSLN